MSLNIVQKAAYDLIQSDARFLYTLMDVMYNAPNIKTNYILMSQPYVGIFTDGAEQWCRKVGLNAPTFTVNEKAYYTVLRQSHKLFEKPYAEYKQFLMDKFDESENYFYSIRRLREKILGYYNVGTDLCNGEFCGNTILCSMYIPLKTLGNDNAGIWIKNLSVISGKLAGYFKCTDFPMYKYNVNIEAKPEDYHFYENCPIKLKNNLGFLLFSVLCSINYIIYFIEEFFEEEIPQKFKFAYLQYYYLCDFIEELNEQNGTSLYLDDSLKNRAFRNCLAHYGLGQVLSANEVIEEDVLKGLTNKIFDMDYGNAKEQLFSKLTNLAAQIKSVIFD